MPLNSEVDGILEAIRAEVRRIKENGDRPTRPSAPGLKSKVESLRLSRGGRVRAGRLLRFRGEEFIRRAYLALLNRQPDPEGLLHWLRMMRKDGVSRLTVIRMLRESQEGRIHNVPVRGLKIRGAGEKLAGGMRAVPLLRKLIPRNHRYPEAGPEAGPAAQDSPDLFIEEMRGRLKAIEDRLDHLDRAVRRAKDDRGRRTPDKKARRGKGPRS